MISENRDRAGNVVELEFALEQSEFSLALASEGTECELRLEMVTPRSDGSVLEYLTVRGADTDTVLRSLEATQNIREVRLLQDSDEETIVECVSESRVATALADEETVVKQITARGGRSRLVAEVPPHVDASVVIESFLAEYPGAQLVARRTTDRQVPTQTREQFLTELFEGLTEKQLRALRLAHANGYFEWPRQHTAEDVAGMLDVATPTFTQHLRSAERKLLDSMFD